MRVSTLLARNLAWYWRTNLAVLLGAATAVGVLGGALLAGSSVRASLRELVLERLGNAEYVVSRSGFFREELASKFPSACPIIAIDGVATHEASGRRAAGVQIYGVDERFWKFQAEPSDAPRGHQALLSGALTQELSAKDGDDIRLRVEKPSAIPLESLHGRKEDVGKTIRLTVRAPALREFSLRARQGEVRAVFAPLQRLQTQLDAKGKVNTILMRSTEPRPLAILKDHYTLEDLGIKLRLLDQQNCLSLETDSNIISDYLADIATATANSIGLHSEPIFTYLVNTIGDRSREIPYSLVAARDSVPDGITLNQWATRELAAKLDDTVSLNYYVWKSDGRLHTESAQFRLTRIVPIEGVAADRDLVPEYPGITASDSLHEWDPPFPIDLRRIRPIDEQYWKQYRTTPKAFIPLASARRLWGTRFGSLTSIRISPPSEAYAKALRAALDLDKMGLTISDVKAQGLDAARGVTDFGEYFVYFSFFLMVSALLLTGLFFRLGVEQRLREIGVLRALGFSISKIRAVFLLEGAVLAVAGAVVGVGCALAYGGLIMLGLRTWWVDAVRTQSLALHSSIPALVSGAAAGIATSLAAIAWTLRHLEPVTPRGLLAGQQKRSSTRRPLIIGLVSGVIALALLSTAVLRKLDHTVGFFGAGTLLLIAALSFEFAWLHSRFSALIRGRIALGFRSATHRAGRSILCIALIAFAVFLVVALDAFRRGESSQGTGGYPLIAESALPLIHDPNTAAGREALNLPPLVGVEFVPFRMRAGDDASCLNLYQPRNPRILAPPAAFLRNSHLSFQEALTPTPNPWLLLESELGDGVVPVIADANSMTYVLHLRLGEEFALGHRRFRIVAALRDSVFQSELLTSEKNFLRLFPDVEGYRFLLLKVSPPASQQEVTAVQKALSDYGFEVQRAEVRLASFHKVENTYLSAFRSLGALGLVLGTVGLAAIVLRNVLERRRELALLRVVGYRPAHLAVIVLAENFLLLLLGVATGTVCALVAISPVVSLRGAHLPVLSLGLLLATVVVTGIGASLAATAAALRSPVLAALRSE